MIQLLITKIKMQIKKSLISWQGLTTVLVVGVLASNFALPPFVNADQYDDQINALRSQNSQSLAAQESLATQAVTITQIIDKLRGDIALLENQIAENQIKEAQVKQQIVEAEAELARQKKLLGENIKAMYLEGEISTLEQLASSKDLSEFVDREQYRNAVKNKIKSTLDRINELRVQLDKQKLELEALIREQQVQQAQLGTQRAEQSRLLALNQEQQASYANEVRSNNSRIADLKAQQAAAFARATNGGRRNSGNLGSFEFRNLSGQEYCGGGYSYCWAYHDQYVSDTWGLQLARECVHYAADRAARGVNLEPYLGAGRGNAYQWPGSLSGQYRTDNNPTVGSVAVAYDSQIPPVGHVMYVEYVTGDGWVGVSQMNFDGRGSYSTMEVKASSVDFIHFN